MKKILLISLMLSSATADVRGCAWYDPDYEYFNLFTQNIIRDKSYTPFLLTYSNWFYEDPNSTMPDDNIEAWKKYFNNELSFAETKALIYDLKVEDLNQLKNFQPQHPLLQKIGYQFYKKYSEGIDYLIEAKYLEPYMRISHIDDPDSFYYYGREDNDKDATHLDYQKTIATLSSLYDAAKNPEIKLRYGYQIVRFNHYNRNYPQTIAAFQHFIQPLKVRTAPYYMALDQFAGAQRALGQKNEANWNFFQVFMHTNSRKKDAYISMQLTDEDSFKNLLSKTTNQSEKNVAYFLLAYQDFNNPISTMEKMYDINPNSELLKVMEARAINELERNILQLSYYGDNSENLVQTDKSSQEATTKTPTKNNTVVEKESTSLWDKFIGFIKNLFGGDKTKKDFTESGTIVRTADVDDEDLLNNPYRLPITNNKIYKDEEEIEAEDYLNQIEKFTNKVSQNSNDEFWKIAEAYLKFLQKDYKESAEILATIKTTNPEYIEQIKRMRMLNDIVAQPRVDKKFEDHIMTAYPNLFVEKEQNSDEENYEYPVPSTNEFLRDILANRYFLQGEDAKSYLMNNNITALEYSPDVELTKKIEAFFKKPNKTTFEKEVVAKNMESNYKTDNFFNLIYGDHELRNGNISGAQSFYSKIKDFKGLDRMKDEHYDARIGEMVPNINDGTEYNGFNNVSPLVFGHNYWESYESPEYITMLEEDFGAEFPQVNDRMNKFELTKVLSDLKKTTNSKDAKGAMAAQLLGNFYYNTSILGYFRHILVMDINNGNGGKYYFDNIKPRYTYYYKNYPNGISIKSQNFNLATEFYKQALTKATDAEQKARILFQLASVEQGNFYQWKSEQPRVSYNTKNWNELVKKQEESFKQTKNEKFRTYFLQLKNNYANTQTVKDLRGSCSYFDYFMRK